jgi:hypothetical protein
MQLFDCRLLVFMFVFPALLLSSWDSRADDSDVHKTVGGIDIFIGVLPVEIIRGRGKMEHTEMHGGAPKRRDSYHLVVALFDRDSGARVTEASVSATIAAPGMALSKKDLEPMKISDVVTFGNYFNMSSRAANSIALVVELPRKPILKAEFYYAAER